MRVVRRQSGFTLIELLVVISILAILAALTVPALKNLGKSNVNVSAARQLLDDVGRARQLALSQRSTVYMVFVPTNFWLNLTASDFTTFNTAEFLALTNLADKQLTGYAFVSYGALGDQPGNHQWHYLSTWQNLPDATFIAAWKFLPNTFPLPNLNVGGQYTVPGFVMQNVPFPTVSNAVVNLPCIAFNYLGQLTTNGTDAELGHEYIPLAQGTVSFGINYSNRSPALNVVLPGAIVEAPPGNSTNSMFNLVDIDGLTGRSRLEFQKVQ